jgi:hypothetical protein
MEVDCCTAVVLTLKVAVVAPAGTVTVGGTPATAVSLLDRETSAPPTGAGPFSSTMAVHALPPFKLEWSSSRAAGAGGATIREAVCEAPEDAEIMTVAGCATELVVTV